MIILLGASGYVGRAIAGALRDANVPFAGHGRSTVDLANTDAIEAMLKETEADFVINCAGFTGKPNVDVCEVRKTESLDGNAVLPGRIRQACERVGIPFGHVSSGCIFTGSRPDGSGFNEQDPPNFSFRTNNCSFYSGTKALGEELLADCDSCYVWRLRIPFNQVDSPRNYLTKLMSYPRLLQATNSLTQLDEFARVCVQSWQNRIPFGTYNVVNSGSITTQQVTELIRDHLAPERTFDFFDSTEEFMQLAAVAPRSNCILDNSKLLATGIEMSTVEDAIVGALTNWQPQQSVAAQV
ncbi:sugar nucleotide-binding protein [Stieleria sp. TO1_6]|uniref:sugar nucleotide-binding protein n=1 Tax=Stieleria tagensis TaxID=2956795 RepID=UPI00209B59FB|nr:sugar nucleotide-binding protein [Stieleria tagensis]MCO8120688.1 sugar nucleotide-binding protein [Stieleria tagensis]